MKKQIASGIALSTLLLAGKVSAEEVEVPTPVVPEVETSTTTVPVVTETELENSKASLDSAKSELDSELAVKQDLEKQLVAAETELVTEKAKLAEAEFIGVSEETTDANTKKVESELAKAKEDYFNAVNANNVLDSSKPELVSELANLKEDKVKLEQDIVKVKARIKELEQGGTSIKETHLDSLKAELAKKESQAEELKVRVAEAKKADAIYNRELTDIRNDIAYSKIDRDKIEETISGIESSLTEPTKAKESLEARLQELANKANAFVSELNSVGQTKEDEIAAVVARLNSAKTELGRLNNKLANSEGSNSSTNARIADLESSIQNLQNEVSGLESQLSGYVNEYRSLMTYDLASLKTYFQTSPDLIRHYIGGHTFGATGCVPTVISMAVTELTGQDVRPLDVGYWLYEETNEFNKSFKGTSGLGLMQAARYFGLNAKPLGNLENVVAALKEGHLVTSAVENNKFAPWGDGTTHQILLRGYRNGQTYVYDPYNKSNIGWYSVNSLWREQSTDAIDTKGVGAPFIKLSLPKVDTLESKISTIRETKAAKDSEISTKNSRLSSLRSSLVDTGRLESSISKQTEVVRGIEGELESLNSENARILEARRAIQTKIQEVNNQINPVRAELDSVLADISNLNSRLSSSKADLDTKKERIKVLEANLLEKLKQNPEYKVLHLDYVRLLGRIDNIKAEIAKLSEGVSEGTTEDNSTLLASLNETKVRLGSELSRVELAIRSKENRIKELESEKLTVSENIESLKLTISNLEGTLQGLKEGKVTKVVDTKAIKARIAELEELISQLKGKLEASETRVSSLDSTYKAKLKEYNNLKSSYDTYKKYLELFNSLGNSKPDTTAVVKPEVSNPKELKEGTTSNNVTSKEVEESTSPKVDNVANNNSETPKVEDKGELGVDSTDTSGTKDLLTELKAKGVELKEEPVKENTVVASAGTYSRVAKARNVLPKTSSSSSLALSVLGAVLSMVGLANVRGTRRNNES